MKQLAIITAVVVSALCVVGSAVAKPVGNITGQLEEIGAWAVPTSTQPVAQETLRGKLGEIGAWAVPTKQPAEEFGMTPAESHALLVRSEALNRKYGLGQVGMTPAESYALRVRSEALNQKYGLGVTSETSPGFAWGDAGIGVGVLLGLLALTATAVVSVRHHGRLGTS